MLQLQLSRVPIAFLVRLHGGGRHRLFLGLEQHVVPPGSRYQPGTDPSWNDWRVDPPSINSTRDIQLMHNEALTLPYQNLSVTDCFALYDGYFEPQGNVLIFVTNDTSKVNNSLLLYVSIIPRSDDWGKNMWALSNGNGVLGRPCRPAPPSPPGFWALRATRSSTAWRSPPPDAGKICRFEYCPLIMFIVCFAQLHQGRYHAVHLGAAALAGGGEADFAEAGAVHAGRCHCVFHENSRPDDGEDVSRGQR